MRRKTLYVCTCSTLFAGVMALGFMTFAAPPQNPGNSNGNGNGGGRLSPASLDLDTCGCPTTFGQPTCEEQTSWSLDKVSNTDDLDNPDGEPFTFTVTVTEGPTEQTLIATGTIRISNSGEQTPTLANVAVLLEDLTPGKGNAPGPSGNNWTILAVTAENEHAACGNSAVTCYGVFDQSDGANLVLFNCDDMNDVIALSGHIEIPPAMDDDGDGMTGEDPALESLIDQSCFGIIDNDGDGLLDEDPGFGSEMGIDNDGDGLIDEDPIDGIDNDGDGLIDEDDPDDDGDGLVDEDGPDDDRDGLIDEDDDCDDIVEICFEATFDISGLGIEGPGDSIVPSADDLRIDLLVTFKSGGHRGGTCDLDVDCDGVLENGKQGNPDEGEGHVRTIQQRLRFDPVQCDPTCECPTLTDLGAFSLDESCAVVDNTNTLDEQICATGVEGTQTVRQVTGIVTCACDPAVHGNGARGCECHTQITNIAELTCEDPDLIAGSPAGASFEVWCDEVGDGGGFCGQTQGGWGTDNCNGNNTACLRDTYFDQFFPNGLVVGDPDGPDADGSYSILLTSSAAVAEYLPAGGMPAALTADQTDPETTSSGVFGGQLVAATLNVVFDDNGVGKCTLTGDCDFCCAPGTLGTLVYVAGCVIDELVGLSVNDVIALSNIAISGGGTPAGVTISDLSDALAVLNENFVDCDTDEGCLELP